MPVLCLHGLNTPERFQGRVEHCRTTPSRWLTLFLDKIHAVYRDRNGTTLVDRDDADPVAMTVAGLLPKTDAPVHTPTEAAGNLFVEIMLAAEKARESGQPPGKSRVTPLAITLELDRRKGRRRLHKSG